MKRGALQREIVCSSLGKGLYCKHRYRDGNVGERSVRVRGEDREDREEDITWRNNLEAVGARLRIFFRVTCDVAVWFAVFENWRQTPTSFAPKVCSIDLEGLTCLCTSSSTQHAPDGQRHRAQRPPSPTTFTHRTPPFDAEVCSFDPEVCSFDPEDVIHSDYPPTAITYLHWRACAHNCFPLHTSTHTLPPYARVHARSHVTKQGRSEDDRVHTHTSPRAR